MRYFIGPFSNDGLLRSDQSLEKGGEQEKSGAKLWQLLVAQLPETFHSKTINGGVLIRRDRRGGGRERVLEEEGKISRQAASRCRVFDRSLLYVERCFRNRNLAGTGGSWQNCIVRSRQTVSH